MTLNAGSALARMLQSHPQIAASPLLPGACRCARPSLHLAVIRPQVQAGVLACHACGDECQGHTEKMGMKRCESCAASCRPCVQACHTLLNGLSA